jgi:hypothetical protein
MEVALAFMTVEEKDLDAALLSRVQARLGAGGNEERAMVPARRARPRATRADRAAGAGAVPVVRGLPCPHAPQRR